MTILMSVKWFTKDLIAQISFPVLFERPMTLDNSPESLLLKFNTPLPYKHLHSKLSNVYSKRRWEWLSEDGKIIQLLKKDLKTFKHDKIPIFSLALAFNLKVSLIVPYLIIL